MKNVKIRGKYNEIFTDDIGEETNISGWSFIGENVHIGKNCVIANFCEIGERCWIGDNCSIQYGCVLNPMTRLGNDVMLGGGVIMTDEKYMSTDTKNIVRKPCIFDDHVRVGAGSIFNSTKVDHHVIIGAGSIITKEYIEPNSIWFGNPAKKFKSISEKDYSKFGFN